MAGAAASLIAAAVIGSGQTVATVSSTACLAGIFRAGYVLPSAPVRVAGEEFPQLSVRAAATVLLLTAQIFPISRSLRFPNSDSATSTDRRLSALVLRQRVREERRLLRGKD